FVWRQYRTVAQPPPPNNFTQFVPVASFARGSCGNPLFALAFRPPSRQNGSASCEPGPDENLGGGSCPGRAPRVPPIGPPAPVPQPLTAAGCAAFTRVSQPCRSGLVPSMTAKNSFC